MRAVRASPAAAPDVDDAALVAGAGSEAEADHWQELQEVVPWRMRLPQRGHGKVSGKATASLPLAWGRAKEREG
jgi:hypothetical protein